MTSYEHRWLRFEGFMIDLVFDNRHECARVWQGGNLFPGQGCALWELVA